MGIFEKFICSILNYIFKHAKSTLILCLIITLSAFWPATQLTIDASTDALLLDNDPNLQFYRNIHNTYGTDEYILVVIEFSSHIFEKSNLEYIELLRQKFKSIDNVSNTTSITNIPLVYQRSLTESEWKFPTIIAENINLQEAKIELSENPIYSNNIIDATLTRVAFKIDINISPLYEDLYAQRFALNEKKQTGLLSNYENNELLKIDKHIDLLNVKGTNNYKHILSSIRNILSHENGIENYHISGTPMIISDIRDYVVDDIKTFGVTILICMVIILFLIFKNYKWVVITLVCSIINVTIVSGIIYLLNFNLTIVSSNYIAILIIFSLAIGIHVVIRYQEELAYLDGNFKQKLITSLIHISTPCMYMIITSSVAFISLMISNVKPIIIFGYIMVIGLFTAYFISFTILPLAIKFLHPQAKHYDYPLSNTLLKALLDITLNFRSSISIVLIIILSISIFGISNVTVENRFIDYFKSTTDIHQGLLTIDEHFGGTVPIEIILDKAKTDTAYEMDEEFGDYLTSIENGDAGFSSKSNWYNHRGIKKISDIHEYLENHAQIGTVLSLYSTEKIFKRVLQQDNLDDFQLSVIYTKSSPEVKELLIHPYVSEEGSQARIVARIKDSDRNLVRNSLLSEIKEHLDDIYDKSSDITITITGIGVLYNNVLQSLYRSQILTIGFVFIAIFIMLAILFKSIKYGFIALLPNIFTAFLIIGLMGLFSIPLNIMTITIAAITIGIGVDDAIHYIHRYKKELNKNENVILALQKAQLTVGKALWFTSLTIGAGFILLIFSNFTPTIYFGLFTSIAMICSILATFTIIPILLSMSADEFT